MRNIGILEYFKGSPSSLADSPADIPALYLLTGTAFAWNNLLGLPMIGGTVP